MLTQAQVIKEPALDKIITLIVSLKEDYLLERSNPNPQRLDFFVYFERLLEQTKTELPKHRHDIMLGWLVFEFFYINSEYSYYAPQGGYFNKGSVVYQTIFTELNTLTDEMKLYCLEACRSYLQHTNHQPMISDLYWKTQKELSRELDNTIIYTISKKLKFQVKHLLESPPDSKALSRNLSNMLIKYEVKLNSRYSLFQNQTRRQLLDFMKCISEFCLSIDPQLTKDALNPLTEAYQAQVDNTRLALVLFAVMDIDKQAWMLNQKKTTFWGCDLRGSELYTSCLKEMNVEDVCSIPIDIKIKRLQALLQSIKQLKSTFTKELTEEDRKKLSLVNQYEGVIEQYHAQLEIDKNKPSFSRYCLQMAISKGVQYGIAFIATDALVHLATNMIWPVIQSQVMNTVIGSVAGAALGPAAPLVYVVYSVGGTWIAAQLAQMVKDKIIPAAMAAIYGSILDAIGTAIAGATAGLVVLAFSASAQGLANLLGFYREVAKTTVDLEQQKILMEVLLALPDRIFPQQQKEIILHHRDIEWTEQALDVVSQPPRMSL